MSNTYQVALNLRPFDQAAPSGTLDTTSITVLNADPVIDPSSIELLNGAGEPVDHAVEAGDLVRFVFGANDAGAELQWSYSIDWGDGTVESGPLGREFRPVNYKLAFTSGHVHQDDDPSGTAEDVYIVTLRLFDDDTGYGEYQYELTVKNSPPTEVFFQQLDDAGEPSDAIIEEGASVRFEFETEDDGADEITYTIDWGDGSPIETITRPSRVAFDAPHQFIDDNPTATPVDSYEVTVTATDDDTGTITKSFPVTVANVAPTIVEIPATSSTSSAPPRYRADSETRARPTPTKCYSTGATAPTKSSPSVHSVECSKPTTNTAITAPTPLPPP